MTWVEIADVLRERYGYNSRAALRHAHGWSQRQAANEWCKRWPHLLRLGKQISSYEVWPHSRSGHAPSFDTLDRLAQLYECNVTDLLTDLPGYRHLDSAAKGDVGVRETASYAEPPVDRRKFVAGLAAVAATVPLRPERNQIGVPEVEEIRAGARRLYALDDHFGGNAVYDRAFTQLTEVRRLLDKASYGPTVGRDLQVVSGQLSEMAGWLAFDAGRHDTARHLFAEALCVARITGNDALAVLVMASMSLQCATLGNGREARDLAQAAQRIAQTYGAPRLLSLLAAREAIGHARLQDGRSSAAALLRSEQLLDDQPDADDDDWLAFWGPADLHWTAATAHLALGAAHQAETSSRDALHELDPAYRRNTSLYLAGLADALVAQGELAEGAAVGAAAVDRLAGEVSSGRVRHQLQALRPRLDPHADQVPAVRSYLDQLDGLPST